MNSKANTQNDFSDSVLPPPWYRVGMVWLVIALPTIVVIASLLTVVIAHKHAPVIKPAEQNSVEVSR